MTWGKPAAHALAEAVGGWFSAGEVVAAAAAVDESGTVIAASPADMPADGRFEVGSITKTMTAAVLASLAADGALGLDDPIGRWLSAGPNGEITIRQLATHTSGLPATAPNWQPARDNLASPWAGYTFQRAEEGLRQATATPGSPWRYSNLGYQLLGLILQRASGTDYPLLMTERLLAPLAMTHSGVGQRGRGSLLPGHAAGRQVPRWDHPWGAGGVEATIADLARYARACLFPPDTPLGTAIRLAQAPVLPRPARPAGTAVSPPQVAEPPRSDSSWQALAWVVENVANGTVCWHTGGTGGFSSCVMIDHGRGRAVAALLSYGGTPVYASRLTAVARLALAGADPRQAAEPEPWPSWREDALDAARALLAGDIAQVHARLAPQRREKVSAQQLDRACRKAMPHAAPQADVRIVQHEVAASGAVVAHLAITTADDSSGLRVVILPTGELGGFTGAPAA
jgi:CubicO group peptidase (beta-lactamase class C family)